ncbi:hypothetical protein [Pedobacter metabolipauper]|uniref:Uncharacterized protein n=1 Tax=Pedobacter metabolipauper TaxID=425513 RepID=A0A4R6T1D3_9SPHI|nr:hypothetical protein [Pedobacter metabolipauper]TDQ11428.1 hypothetical protein ATK78_0550 [Pedobacter metabolipauper]
MKINDYIESGILESYVLGSASRQEAEELLNLKDQYPEIQEALSSLEKDMERIARHSAITPPPNSWDKIENRINEIVNRSEPLPLEVYSKGTNDKEEKTKPQEFIEVQGPSSHMRIHKTWRLVFAAVFVLGKVFLCFAIYYYLESRQAKLEIQELKSELRTIHQK